METIEIAQAVLEINELLEIVAKGQEIIITKNHEPMVKLTAAKPQNKRLPLFGSDRDIIAISDDFDEPLDDFQEYM
ncbi:type II toxin-antitoxin system prevent-host-death family antitoxin [Rivularia sp. UHCC 0363]|uniref:type II toxin-antitoxin system Phd/YefM family antitoxin n=1 Tax=Rivularia sp. UHCC 0363 TaxID=3110244 RepID=UPI002B20FFA5|nr:type II toxin-antitoxin system prevent-host-death family antitoxin [Rivularia sp. UHCC 0363]MEA5593286.1 type II toxin-antitoxin system prevent-host-death family antitoxin [Rivularia sp. UHCC 0363]